MWVHGSTRTEAIGRQDFQCFTVDDQNLVTFAHVKELLLRIRRQREGTGAALGEQLRDIFAINGKDLDAVVASIADVNHSIVRHANRVNRSTELWWTLWRL